MHAFVWGIVLCLLALVIAEATFGAQGHQIEFRKLPPEVRAIAMERHPNPVSAEQWKRMDKAMERHGGWPDIDTLFAATQRKAWPLFVAFPAVALIVLQLLKRTVPLLSAILLFLPSLIVVSLAFSVSLGPYLHAPALDWPQALTMALDSTQKCNIDKLGHAIQSAPPLRAPA